MNISIYSLSDIFVYFNISIYRFIYLCIYLFICLFIFPSIYLSIRACVYLPYRLHVCPKKNVTFKTYLSRLSTMMIAFMSARLLQCVVVCCGVLQYVTVCCSVLQCVAGNDCLHCCARVATFRDHSYVTS